MTIILSTLALQVTPGVTSYLMYDLNLILNSVFLSMQDVNGGNNVSKKKLQKWDQTIKDMDRGSNFENIDLKTNQKLPEKGDLQDLLEVIQYVITDAFNNKEFRQFMIKRFLHNYVPQGIRVENI